MVRRLKCAVAPMLLMAIITLAGGLTNSCSHRPPRVDDESYVEQAGEPDQYSTTVVRTVDDGTTRETTVTREARSGEKRRQEWTEHDQNRALIWRPDLGKGFLLDLDRRVYVEIAINLSQARELDPGAGSADMDSGSSRLKVGNLAVESIDRYFDDAQSPAKVETRMLSPVIVDGHSCRVYEQRMSFLDGHTETTKRFRADDLGGLAIRIESGSEKIKVTTERRDVRIEVPPDAFEVPADFKKIEKLHP